MMLDINVPKLLRRSSFPKGPGPEMSGVYAQEIVFLDPIQTWVFNVL